MITLSNITTLISSAILIFSCSKEQPSTPDRNTNHLQFFGFTLIDTYWDDPTDDKNKMNYIDEVASFSNVADMLVIGPKDNLVERMEQIERYQMKAILHLHGLFFEQTGTTGPSGVKYSLRTDFQNRWDEFVQVNDLQTNQNLIQAFYIGEEPTWNGISYEELKSATDYVDQHFPDLPIMVIEAYPILDRLRVPTSVDWVGFDHYFVKDPGSDPDYQQEWALIHSKLSSPHQRLVVIMDSHYIPEIHGEISNIALEEMGEIAQNYYQLAKSDTSVIALLGYFWPNGFDVPKSIGARGMPESVKDEYARIGKEITGK